VQVDNPTPAPLLSILLPSYNHARFILERLDSIYCQALSEFELIVLDDASPDDSVEIIKEYLDGRNYTLVVNSVNSGSPFSQWVTGLRLARGRYVWIAESDDTCKPAFVSSLLPVLESGFVSIAFSRTLTIDECGLSVGNSFWPERLNNIFFASNQIIPCRSFLSKFQLARNCIPNVSSAIFQIDGFKHGVIEAARIASRFRFAGDWVFWNQLLKAYDAKGIFYCASPLCLHRDHAGTTRVTLSKTAERHRIREYSSAINHAMSTLGIASVAAFFDAISLRWWDWSYEEYLERYKPSALERLMGFPQHGFHFLGYLSFRMRLVFRRLHARLGMD
jgi:glycosyltransferase involved in cell wall biosynthesis